MKSCAGCRFAFADTVGGSPAQRCRARPPALWLMLSPKQWQEYALYPLLPAVRCGLFRRRWFGKMPSAAKPE